MTPLPRNVTDEELIALTDRWAAILESEDYSAAFDFTEQILEMKWTPLLIREVVKAYGDADPTQRVTLHGKPTDITQRKHIDHWPKNAHGAVGEIWYDLNINGLASDLTAIFAILERENGLVIALNDIHVM